jgi:hypothetical protein
LIHDPDARGRTLAAFFLDIEPRLFADLEESGCIPASALPHRARREWECFALYACVRGLVAAGGFNRETAAAIDGLHTAVLEEWMTHTIADENFDQRRARISERYAEYGAIGQQGGAAGAETVTARLGAAAAAHIAAPIEPHEGLADVVGGAHEALVEGATEAVRRAGVS